MKYKHGNVPKVIWEERMEKGSKRSPSGGWTQDNAYIRHVRSGVGFRMEGGSFFWCHA